MTTPAEGNEGRSASSGTTRTPPPRTRRGAPTTRSSFEELDALDELLQSHAQGAGGEPEPAPPDRGWGAGTRGAPASRPAFDWETPEEQDAREATEARFGAEELTDVEERAVAEARRAADDDAGLFAPAGATEVFGDPLEPEIAFEPTPATRPAKTKPAKRPERRFRQTIQKVDLWSVTKMALCFYVSAMGVVVVSLVALWVVADSAGIIDNVENFIGDLFSSDDFQFVSGQVLRGAVLIGVVLVALMVAFTIIAASFYNIFAELFGGVEVVIREEEQPPKR